MSTQIFLFIFIWLDFFSYVLCNYLLKCRGTIQILSLIEIILAGTIKVRNRNLFFRDINVFDSNIHVTRFYFIDVFSNIRLNNFKLPSAERRILILMFNTASLTSLQWTCKSQIWMSCHVSFLIMWKCVRVITNDSQKYSRRNDAVNIQTFNNCQDFLIFERNEMSPQNDNIKNNSKNSNIKSKV